MNHHSTTRLTQHADVRTQQRCLPPLILDWLQLYGRREHDGRGAEIVYFDKSSRKTLASVVGCVVVQRVESLLDAYIVLSGDGCVITAGWRSRPVRHR